MRSNRCVQPGKINLESSGVRIHNNELGTGTFFDKTAVLREKRCDRDKLVPRLGKCPEAGRKSCCGTDRHIKIVGVEIRAETPVQILCHRRTHGGIPLCARIAVGIDRTECVEHFHNCPADGVRCGDTGVADAEIVDIFCADFGNAPLPVFKNLTDGRAVLA